MRSAPRLGRARPRSRFAPTASPRSSREPLMSPEFRAGATDLSERRRSGVAQAAVFDRAPCVAPHPSTLAAALLAYDARIDTDRRRGLTLDETLGDGGSATAETALGLSELITGVALPPPIQGERAAYKRAIGRAHSE